MSGIYIPGAFSKNKLIVETPVVVPLEEIKIEQESKIESQKEPEKVTKMQKPLKPIILEIKPVEVKQSAWGGKKSFVECLKTVSIENQPKEEPIFIKKNNIPICVQKEIKKEEFDNFMDKYDSKLRKLYEKSIYYDKEYFSKLRINGEQGYLTFCKFMFNVI
jgi:hypothetical protein